MSLVVVVVLGEILGVEEEGRRSLSEEVMDFIAVVGKG